MACKMSAALLVPLLVSVLFFAGAQADASEFHAVPVPPATSNGNKDDCPLIPVPDVVDACRRSPGLSTCVQACIARNYRGGHCDIQANGRPGDCTCLNCIGTTQA